MQHASYILIVGQNKQGNVRSIVDKLNALMQTLSLIHTCIGDAEGNEIRIRSTLKTRLETA